MLPISHLIIFCCLIFKSLTFNFNIMKKILFFLTISLLFSNASYAIDLSKDLKLVPTIGASSQQISGNTGVVGNRNKPSGYVGATLKHSVGPYISLTTTQNQNDIESNSSGKYKYETCGVVGLNPSIQKLSVNLSFENCKIGTNTDKNTGIFYFGLSGEVAKDLSLYANYWKDDNDGAAGVSAGKSNFILGKGYNGGFTYSLPVASLGLAYGKSDNFSTWYKASVGKELAGINLDLSIWKVNMTNNRNYISQSYQKAHDREHVILNVSKSF